MSSEVLLPGLVDFDISHDSGMPEISNIYRESLSRLVLLQENGVTHFYGGPLDLDDDKEAWLSPIEVDDGESFSYFQLIYVNTKPQEALNDTSIPVSIIEVDEAGYKLTPPEHPDYMQLMNQFVGKRKHILVRHCNTGMAYYPRSIVPGLEDQKRVQHLERLVAVAGLHEPEVSITLSKPSDHDREPIHTRTLDTVHARRYGFAGGEVHSYGLMLENDPWKYYEVFTPRPIEKMETRDVLVRVDSGCDIGQIFDDRGCDCREQLHTALTEIQRAGSGMVIHIPAQDGRGFGAATKMETEGLKRGIEVASNKGDLRPYDTITAAQMLLGNEFDIRTYSGAGSILGMLGIQSVLLQTDNRLKTEGLAAGGITVVRKPTNTTAARGAATHVEAKHQHNGIYYGRDEG